MELYNAETGKLLCGSYPNFGQTNRTYDEKGYIGIPPCLWGDEDGLPAPVLLSLDTQLLAVKKNNNTIGHYGDMASWQMRGIVVPKEPKLQRRGPWIQPDLHV